MTMVGLVLAPSQPGRGGESVSPSSRRTKGKAQDNHTQLDGQQEEAGNLPQDLDTEWAECQPGAQSPLSPVPSTPLASRPSHTLSATVAASEVLTVMLTTARAMPTSATTNTWWVRRGCGGVREPDLWELQGQQTHPPHRQQF